MDIGLFYMISNGRFVGGIDYLFFRLLTDDQLHKFNRSMIHWYGL